MHAFFDGYISGRSSLKQFVEQYEVALRFKYEKGLESQTSKRKHLVRPTIVSDWDMQIYGHYTCAIYDFFRVHVVRLPHCEIERHVDFNAVEGVEVYNVTDCSIQSDYHGDNFVFTVEYRPANQYIECNCKTFESEGIACCHIMRTMTFKKIRLFHDRYILRCWRRDIVRPHLSKFFPGGYPTMTDEYRVYNGIKKWLDRNCDLVLDCPIRRRT
ncbi:protein FAR-RED IMPAIRED RESPONSE 1-like [Capsicum annuum]|uniref:protein FAR-RED IMPAIRED RESPONSE 1-like n=1 Tax=Capsicum annuum TaxID=4072 RepID=UPI001FB0A768|nr:protein FAR-RED IMPAIRED RESPONSE 1-like [Capsicum annuum]